MTSVDRRRPATSALSPAPSEQSATLATTFDPRCNSLDLLRLILATTVAVVHSSAIAYGHQPHLGTHEVGELAVDAFFVLSGFLVARSFLQLGSVGRYAWHRFLRIMPAFWVCLLLTATLVAPAAAALEGREAGSIYPESFGYVLRNGLLFISDFSVAGLPTQTAVPHVVNGALWTLFYEAVCYVGVIALGVAGALTRRRWLTVAATVLVAAVLLGQEAGLLPERGGLFLRFFLMFGLGTLGLLYGSRVQIRRRWLVLALVVLAVTLWAPMDYRAIGGSIAFAYVCLYAVVRTPWLRHRPRADLSYGMYVYHWPIETLLVLAGATALTQAGYTLLAVFLAGLAATLSWYLIEKPALSHKSMPFPSRLSRRRRREPAREAGAASASVLAGAVEHAGDHLPLQDEIGEHDGQGDDDRARRQQREALGVLALEEAQPQRRGAQRFVRGQHDQGDEELVPRPQEEQHDEG